MIKKTLKRLSASLIAVSVCSSAIHAQTYITPVNNENVNKDWTVFVKGIVQADFMLDFQDMNAKEGFVASSITLPQHNELGSNFSIKQSQLGIGVSQLSNDLSAYIEIDFLGPRETTAPRFRHGFVKWKNFTVGQTWSNICDLDIFPNILDFIGPDGTLFVRRVQVRYSTPVSANGNLSVSIEDPKAPSITLPSDSLNWHKRTIIPMATAVYRYGTDRNYIKVGGLITPISYAMKYNVQDPYVTKTICGAAGIVSGKFHVNDMNNFRFQSSYGKGYATTNSVLNEEKYDAVPNPQNKNLLETLSLLNIVAIYEHWWTPKWSSVIYYSHSQVGKKDFVPSHFTQNFQDAGINLVYQPYKRFRMGAESTYGRNHNFAGQTGTAFRLQFSTSLSF